MVGFYHRFGECVFNPMIQVAVCVWARLSYQQSYSCSLHNTQIRLQIKDQLYKLLKDTDWQIKEVIKVVRD